MINSIDYISILISILIVVCICISIIVRYKVNKRRQKRFDKKWLTLMKKIVTHIEIDYNLKTISESEYKEYMKEINEQIKEYEKWV